MDRSGMRWTPQTAEAIVQLRVIYLSGDFDQYWQFHIEQDQRRCIRPELALSARFRVRRGLIAANRDGQRSVTRVSTSISTGLTRSDGKPGVPSSVLDQLVTCAGTCPGRVTPFQIKRVIPINSAQQY
jgi:hypothetical protein